MEPLLLFISFKGLLWEMLYKMHVNVCRWATGTREVWDVRETVGVLRSACYEMHIPL